MSLKRINDVYIDLKKVSYLGLTDTHVKSHIGVTIHYFLIIVDGHPIEIISDTKDNLLKIRQNLLDELNKVEGLLPG